VQREAGRQISHYVIQEKIGEGGMGVVYRARDESLRRDVALKVLPAELVGNAERRLRFLREARAAAAVTHPNIAVIYEVGEADGELFLAMELVKGQNLRARLRDGPLSIPEAVEYAAQVTEGLARAHDSGIVHRDLKPENIVIGEDGRPKILDFGLAKVIEEQTRTLPSDLAEAETASLQLTRHGMAMGTPVYMSPEQARGEQVDFRTDIFSLGITLYEMVTGKVPFRGKTIPDTLAAIINKPTPRPSAADSRIPPRLEKLLLRCLEKDAAKRYQRTAELATDLREIKETSAPATTRILRSVRRRLIWLAPLAIATGLALVFGLNVRGARDAVIRTFAPQRITSVAVLPLQNLSGDPAQDYFAAGITEAVISKLGQIASVQVTSRTSVMRFKDSTLTLPEIARTLGVDAIVEGSVMRVTNRVAVNARLIEAATDRQLWSQEYEHDLLDVLNLPNEVARTIAHSIRAELSPEDRRRLAAGDEVDPEAYDLYLRGRYELAYEFSNVAAEKALDYFQRATDLAPDFALAHAATAEVYSRVTTRFSPEEAVNKGKTAALRAIELDDSLGVAYAALGKIQYIHAWDWVGAEDYLREGLEREPNNVSVLQNYAMYLLLVGRLAEGIELNRRSVELDPLTPTTQQQLALGYAWARRWDEAFVEYDRLRDLIGESPNPTVEWGLHYQLAYAYLFAGRYEEARVEAEQAKLQDELIWISVLEGDRETGYEELDWYEAQDPGKTDPMSLAILCAVLGEQDKAFTALDRAYEKGHYLLAWINVLPVFDSLRADPRFDDLRRRIGFPV